MLDQIFIPVWISLKTAVVATIITFCLGVAAAWWVAQYRGRGKSLIDGILTAPLVLPPTVLGFLLLLALGKNGIIGKPLDSIGIRIIFTWYATVIAATVVAFPLMYKTALAAFQEDKTDLIACARTLGASEITIFWRIILPLAKSSLIAGTLLSFARALGEFGATYMLAGSIPGKTQTIPIAIFLAAESGAMDLALWLVLILLSVSFGVAIAINGWDSQYTNANKRQNYRLRGSKNHKYARNVPNFRDCDPQARGKFNHRNFLEVDIQKQLSEFALDIAFKIDAEQSSLGILGASGAGKTTLLRCIAGLETPDRGKIILNGKIWFDSAQGINLSPQQRSVGLLLQNYSLFPHLTVAENIAFGMPTNRSAIAIQTEVNQELAKVNLENYGDRLPQKLSGGEQQRIALARAIASNPTLTLLDEPFSALDTNLKAKLLELLAQRLKNYSGLNLYITHNLQEAYYLCSHLLIIDRGKAIAFARKQNIVHHPPNLKTAQLVGDYNYSRAQLRQDQTIEALDWHCQLKIEQPRSQTKSQSLQQIAIDRYAIAFTRTRSKINTFPAWLVQSRELPQGILVYLKLHSAPHNLDDYHLEAEINGDRWQWLQQDLPWYIHLPCCQNNRV